jgi:integrase
MEDISLMYEQIMLCHYKPPNCRPQGEGKHGRSANPLRTSLLIRKPPASLSAFFAWCMGEGLVEANPVIGTNVAPEPARERVLSMSELAAVWKACGDDSYGAIARLLILTGQRREEIGGPRRDEIRDDMIVLPGERTKNKRSHVIPLSSLAQDVLRPHQGIGPFVFGDEKTFGSWSYGRTRVDAALAAAGVKLAPWVLHDLRRSVATHMAEIGIQPHIIESVLNHTGGHKAGVAGIYNRATYDREKRQALDLWADHVFAAVEGRATNVMPLRA